MNHNNYLDLFFIVVYFAILYGIKLYNFYYLLKMYNSLISTIKLFYQLEMKKLYTLLLFFFLFQLIASADVENAENENKIEINDEPEEDPPIEVF